MSTFFVDSPKPYYTRFILPCKDKIFIKKHPLYHKNNQKRSDSTKSISTKS